MIIGLKRVNEAISFINIEGTLNDFQNLVEGFIEIVPFSIDGQDNLVMVLNEEGKILNLPKNFFYLNDTIVGNVIITKMDDYGDFEDLNDEDILKIKNKFEELN